MEESRRTTLSEVFLDLRLPREARILDVACGTGIVAEELRPHGYDNIDGLDPVKGYLATAQDKKLYRVREGVQRSLHFDMLVQPAAMVELGWLSESCANAHWHVGICSD